MEPTTTPDISPAIAEAERVLGRASLQHRLAHEAAQPHLQALQQAQAVLEAAQERLFALLQQAQAEGAEPQP